MEFKDVLKNLRKDAGYTQAELAKKLGFSNGLIGMYESGQRRPSFEALEAIADFFNISIDYLVGKDDKSVYYLDPNVARLAQELFERPEMRILFDASQKATKEGIEQVAAILNKLGNK